MPRSGTPESTASRNTRLGNYLTKYRVRMIASNVSLIKIKGLVWISLTAVEDGVRQAGRFVLRVMVGLSQ